MAAGNTFHLRILSPERVFYEGDVSMLELTTTEGEIGIYAGHIPTTFVLSPGVMRIHERPDGSFVREAALHSGFIEVLPEEVHVIAEAVEWPEEIDLNRARVAQQRAERRLKRYNSGMNVMRTELALRRALVRIEVGEKR
ncbi:MAG: ATP synthase F1 subunit epsilon [Lachnospiraceae bacterium]|nr:ATP synthase F1 subunit epsilon [Lachnospiraceae bacterium]